MHIETERMIIWNYIKDDLKDLQEILEDPEVMKNCETTYTFEFLKEFCIDKIGINIGNLCHLKWSFPHLYYNKCGNFLLVKSFKDIQVYIFDYRLCQEKFVKKVVKLNIILYNKRGW